MAHLEITSPDGSAQTVALSKPAYILGRDVSCELAFPDDGGLSRQHFSIDGAGDNWVIRDMNSRNGSFVNGVKLTSPLPLAIGDMIKASKLQILYTEPARTGVVFETANPAADPARATVVINLRDLISAAGAPQKPGLAVAPSQWASPVQALLRAGRELVAGRPLPELFRVILDMAIEASGAERGVLMTLENDELVEQAKSEGEFRISSMVRDRVMNDRESLLIHDAMGDAMLGGRQSIVMQNVHALMAVPLQTEDRVIGLIYVDSRSMFRPFLPDDLNLLTVMANVAAIRIERQRLAQIEKAEERHRFEQEQAAKIQRLSLPDKAPEVFGFELGGKNVPCFSVGGDYYDYYHMPDGRLMIVIGDVAGKGMPAALLVMSLQAYSSALALTASDAGQFVAQLNDAIHPRCPGDRFITFFSCILDPATGDLTYCNAGHNPPLLLRAAGGIEELPPGGLVLGIFPGVKYASGATRLERGDQLLLYTDGITEAESPAGEEFDLPILEDVFRQIRHLPPDEMLKELLRRVDDWTKGAPASDDRTIVTIRRT